MFDLDSPSHLAGVLPPMAELQMIQGQDAMQQFSLLMDLCFEVPNDQHYLEDFPVWNAPHVVGPSSRLVRYGVFIHKRLVAATAVRLFDVRTLSGKSQKMALIGAVGTAPDWRGKRLAAVLIEKAIAWATQKGAESIVLWSSRPEYYQKFGFTPFGVQGRVGLGALVKFLAQVSPWSRKSPSAFSRHESLLSFHAGWDPRLFELIQGRNSGTQFLKEDTKWYASHRNVHWLSARRRTDTATGFLDEPSAYLAWGRGIDLSHMIHEWGGDRRDLVQLLFYLNTQQNLSPQKRGTPLELLGHPQLIEDFFNYPASQLQCEPLCLRKILPGALRLPEEDYWFWGLDAA